MAKKEKETIGFSKSRMDLQEKCLGMYFYKYIQKIKVSEVVYPQTVIGEAIHLYLSNLLKSLTPEKFKELSEKVFVASFTYKNFIKKIDQEEYSTLFERYLGETEKTKTFKLSRGWDLDLYLESCNKWIWEIIKFVLKFFKFTSLESEVPFEYEYKVGKQIVMLKGVIDILLSDKKIKYIADFKNTKDSSKYFFINWDEDVQSLTYLYAHYKMFKKIPNGFFYLVFNAQEKMILVTSTQFSEKPEIYLERFEKIIVKFLDNHEKSKDEKNYEPAKEKCKWCDFKKHCKVADI